MEPIRRALENRRKARAWMAVADAMLEYPDIAADVVWMVQRQRQRVAQCPQCGALLTAQEDPA